MLSISYTAGITGLDGYIITVECNMTNRLQSFEIIGLPDNAVKESKERIKSAIINSGYKFPDSNIVINLAPADVKKEGSAFDLAMSAAILYGNKTIASTVSLKDKCFIG